MEWKLKDTGKKPAYSKPVAVHWDCLTGCALAGKEAADMAFIMI
jgi:hypothetical protein